MADALTENAVGILNHILEMELAGTIHYTHYSFMVYGYNRIPIVKWLEEQAVESMAHARAAGELVEEYAREHIYLEMQHIGEVDKMLRRPGDIQSFEQA